MLNAVTLGVRGTNFERGGRRQFFEALRATSKRTGMEMLKAPTRGQDVWVVFVGHLGGLPECCGVELALAALELALVQEFRAGMILVRAGPLEAGLFDPLECYSAIRRGKTGNFGHNGFSFSGWEVNSHAGSQVYQDVQVGSGFTGRFDSRAHS